MTLLTLIYGLWFSMERIQEAGSRSASLLCTLERTANSVVVDLFASNVNIEVHPLAVSVLDSLAERDYSRIVGAIIEAPYPGENSQNIAENIKRLFIDCCMKIKASHEPLVKTYGYRIWFVCKAGTSISDKKSHELFVNDLRTMVSKFLEVDVVHDDIESGTLLILMAQNYVKNAYYRFSTRTL